MFIDGMKYIISLDMLFYVQPGKDACFARKQIIVIIEDYLKN